jgi:hypothetical protein
LVLGLLHGIVEPACVLGEYRSIAASRGAWAVAALLVGWIYEYTA